MFFTFFPNPFNSTTGLRFNIALRSEITLSIYDINGRLVEVAASGDYSAGVHRVNWDGMNVPSGLYVARLEAVSSEAADISQIKLLLIK